jgi:hypothetical protein
MSDQVQEKPQKSIYMTKYYSNPEFKKKHNEYMMQFITCECGCSIMRCNVTKHRKSQKHLFTMKLYKNCTPAEIQKYLELKKSVQVTE